MSFSGNNSDQDFEFIPKSRQKAEEIASQLKFFKKPIFTAEQVEKVREPVKKFGAELGTKALGAPSELLKFIGSMAQIPDKYLETLGGSKALMKQLESITGESYEPKGEAEEYSRDIAGGLGSIIGLGGGQNLARTTVVPFLSASVKHGLKYGGAPEWAQTGGAIITDMLGAKFGSPNARQVAKNLHSKAETLIPQGASLNAASMERQLQNIVQRLSKGGTDSAKTPALNKAKEMLDTIQKNKGNFPIDELFAYRTAINSIMGDPALLKGGKEFLLGLNRIVNKGLKEYGQTNPAFYKTLREGDELLMGIGNAKKATQFLEPKLKGIATNPLTWIALGLNPKTYLTALGGKTLAEFTHKLFRSQALRRHYFNTLKFAAKNEGKAAVHELNKFDKEINKEFPDLQEGDFEFIEKH